ncbi:glutaredoxin domain-containing protein [Clostridium tertium]|jgi:glutaredoxin-like YruB-family protein|uniref:Glutathione S-transferase N-terminal domain-containing protein n=1 Tax=Clostridium tertium TaxID=1559 RepID=A0A9X3XKQ7_9CLOT|nr:MULTISPECIES: glutaredoxin domain-containing protein [Clostridium]EEH96390.1 glutaredoxin-like protein, YruB-family [Clostridium sp. 7_2_43FAA]MBP1870187.1 glutaredoxin-like YruB-family protein [Clostridium tertium]MBS5308630.1 glutathione S-transferase N-terminal domain-containing protein [Clostridium sp.]MBS5886646.1 glutathione S-transferase N-terminal domain-containing protein [Clostridium sp.]MBS6503174.1 glutathione S-transferase N-terminal domain-containing protein [Clostridium sp.]
MIKIYSTSWCPSCIKAKRFFEMKGWDYKEINVADKHEDREEVFKVSGQRTVPVIDIDGEIIVGFDRNKIELAKIK